MRLIQREEFFTNRREDFFTDLKSKLLRLRLREFRRSSQLLYEFIGVQFPCKDVHHGIRRFLNVFLLSHVMTRQNIENSFFDCRIVEVLLDFFRHPPNARSGAFGGRAC